jgi:hypothetical protein
MLKFSCYLLQLTACILLAAGAVDVAGAVSDRILPPLVGQMPDPISEHILTPIAQMGFAGAFALAAALVWWFARTRREDWNTWHSEQLKSVEKTSQIITLNTEAHIRVVDGLANLTNKLTDLGAATVHLTEELIGRPCLLKDKDAP